MIIHKVLPLSLLLVGIILFYSPLLTSNTLLGIQDWDQNFAWAEATRIIITRFHQFPFWDPYRCGGSAHFANPQISVISLQTLFVILFGTISGIKINILAHSFIGFIGFYLLSNQYGLSKKASIVASIIFSFNGIIGSFLSTGMVVFISYAYSPYILLFFDRAKQQKEIPYTAAALLALSYYAGYHICLILILYLVLQSVIDSILNRCFHPLRSLFQLGIIFSIFSLPKLLLSLQLMSVFPRLFEDISGFTFSNLWYFLTSPDQQLGTTIPVKNLHNAVDENSLYVGIIPMFFFFLFPYSHRSVKEKLSISLLLICIILLMLGNVYRFSLYSLIHDLPILSSFRVAQRFRFAFIIPFSFMIGIGFDHVIRRLSVRKANVFFIIVVLLLYIDMALFSSRNFFQLTLVVKDTYPTAFQEKFSQKTQYDDYILSYIENSVPKDMENSWTFSPWSFEYILARQNIGTIYCYDSITGNVSARGSDENDYRGEWYVANGSRKIILKDWTPHRISVILTKTKTLPADDILVLNQNYYPGWYAKKGDLLLPAENFTGLIATRVDSDDEIVTFIHSPYRWIFDNYVRSRFMKM